MLGLTIAYVAIALVVVTVGLDVRQILRGSRPHGARDATGEWHRVVDAGDEITGVRRRAHGHDSTRGAA